MFIMQLQVQIRRLCEDDERFKTDTEDEFYNAGGFLEFCIKKQV
jgi:hypothetical protein